MSAQEAAYHCLSLPLSKSSRGSVYISTCPIDERVRMLKSNQQLGSLDKDSRDVFLPNIFEKYSKRPKKFEGICLADFAAFHYFIKNFSEDINDDEEIIDLPEERPKVLRYRRYKLVQDSYNYYREQLLLFLPWRNERSEVEEVDGKQRYQSNIEEITKNRSKFNAVADESLTDAMEEVNFPLTPVNSGPMDGNGCL